MLRCSLSIGPVTLLGPDVTGSQAQKPTSAIGSMTDTAQLTAAAHTHKTMYAHTHAPVHTKTHTYST